MENNSQAQEFHIRPGYPDFLDLPWELSLSEWEQKCSRLVEVHKGLCRHQVVFVDYNGKIFAIKELPDPLVAEKEYENLKSLLSKKLPTVTPVGHARIQPGADPVSILITEFLDYSMPYRSLFIQPGLFRYRGRLLDSMACLLVRLHLVGFFWGDCSLSNVLFKRDAGELGAYVVDVETSSVQEPLPEALREEDLAIMEENVFGALTDLSTEFNMNLPQGPREVVDTIIDAYKELWEEINKEVIISKDDRYRIHDRIKKLNQMGFSVDEVELIDTGPSGKLKVRTLVTDQNYHRHHLQNITGIAAMDNESRQMLNEIQTYRATMQSDLNRSVPLSVAAFQWLNEVFYPSIEKLKEKYGLIEDPASLYCQLLEHKWFLSEEAGTDVGLGPTLEDFLDKFSQPKPGSSG